MSIKTWKKEFYGNMRESIKSKKKAIEHSLQKWKGLTKENLIKHNVEIENSIIYDNYDSFTIDANSCALCKKYRNRNCCECPLYELLGTECYKYKQPYDDFLEYSDPKPMIKALQILDKENK